MRIALAFLMLASPAAAWEFSASPICTLTKTTPEGTITVTYDASLPEYAVAITLPEGTWPDAPLFGMAFTDDRPVNIQTNRHERIDAGRTIIAKDRGFGNVLAGLEFNSRAYAIAGDVTVGFSLDGIKGPITDFRNCPAINMS